MEGVAPDAESFNETNSCGIRRGSVLSDLPSFKALTGELKIVYFESGEAQTMFSYVAP